MRADADCERCPSMLPRQSAHQSTSHTGHCTSYPRGIVSGEERCPAVRRAGGGGARAFGQVSPGRCGGDPRARTPARRVFRVLACWAAGAAGASRLRGPGTPVPVRPDRAHHHQHATPHSTESETQPHCGWGRGRSVWAERLFLRCLVVRCALVNGRLLAAARHTGHLFSAEPLFPKR